jgi:hypothetical protein
MGGLLAGSLVGPERRVTANAQLENVLFVHDVLKIKRPLRRLDLRVRVSFQGVVVQN